MVVQGRIAVRSKRRFSLSTWSGSIVALTILVAAGVIYQVQQKSPGTYSYQQHVSWIGGAMALPACAFALHWLLVFVLGAVEGRDVRKLKALEAAKRNMIKELKDMSRFDKIKSLIDKFDPDAAQASPAVANSAGGLQGPNYSAPAPGRLQQQHHQYQQQQRLQQPQVPALLMKGSGQVAGAAALAVTGAGKAILPLFDKLATTLISDNPVLLEDLRRAQHQLQEAENRTMAVLQNSYAVQHENITLKQRLVDLEKQLDLPASFNAEALQEQLKQHQQTATQQLPLVIQESMQSSAGQLESGSMQPGVINNKTVVGSSWPGDKGIGYYSDSDKSASLGGDMGQVRAPPPAAISASETPSMLATHTQQGPSSEQQQQPQAGVWEGMGDGLHPVSTELDEQLALLQGATVNGGAAGQQSAVGNLRHTKGSAAAAGPQE
eukprot:GHRR01018343.1.p1 GENE.GHRR01018343.1~~GHRR01018343.1.p1  ORF type:complete len:436 (+),score=201.31 GHRR01018343.1:371-1678(+)